MSEAMLLTSKVEHYNTFINNNNNTLVTSEHTNYKKIVHLTLGHTDI